MVIQRHKVQTGGGRDEVQIQASFEKEQDTSILQMELYAIQFLIRHCAPLHLAHLSFLELVVFRTHVSQGFLLNPEWQA